MEVAHTLVLALVEVAHTLVLALVEVAHIQALVQADRPDAVHILARALVAVVHRQVLALVDDTEVVHKPIQAPVRRSVMVHTQVLLPVFQPLAVVHSLELFAADILVLDLAFGPVLDRLLVVELVVEVLVVLCCLQADWSGLVLVLVYRSVEPEDEQVCTLVPY